MAFVAYLLRFVILPFAIAGALAYLGAPAIRSLQRRMPRWLAGLIVYLAYLVLISAVAFGIVSIVVPEITSFQSEAPRVVHQVLRTMFGGETIRVFGQTLNATAVSAGAMVWLTQLMRNPTGLIGPVWHGSEGLIGVFLCLALLGYFIFDGPRTASAILWLVPPQYRRRAKQIADEVAPVVYSYTRGVLIVMAFGVVTTWIATRFFLHLQRAELLAIGVGIFEMIPLIGAILSLLLVGLAVAQNATVASLIGFAIFITVLRLSIDQLVGPQVLGRAVSLPAPAIIFAFLSGGAIFGAAGVIMAIPTAAAVKIVLEDLYGEPIDTLKGAGTRKNLRFG